MNVHQVGKKRIVGNLKASCQSLFLWNFRFTSLHTNWNFSGLSLFYFVQQSSLIFRFSFFFLLFRHFLFSFQKFEQKKNSKDAFFWAEYKTQNKRQNVQGQYWNKQPKMNAVWSLLVDVSVDNKNTYLLYAYAHQFEPIILFHFICAYRFCSPSSSFFFSSVLLCCVVFWCYCGFSFLCKSQMHRTCVSLEPNWFSLCFFFFAVETKQSR